MFRFLRSDPPREPHRAEAAAPPRTVCDVAFRPQLVAELLDAHERLRLRFRSVVTHYLNDSERACRDALERFDNELRAYLVRDNLEFDPYMRCLLEHDADALLLLGVVQKRLHDIARRVHDVAEAHRGGRLDRAGFLRFGEELVLIDDSIARCLDTRRERLFPRYRLLHGRAAARAGTSAS
jgi:hypothetical protein